MELAGRSGQRPVSLAPFLLAQEDPALPDARAEVTSSVAGAV